MLRTINLLKFTAIVIVAFVALGFNNIVRADRLTTVFDRMSRVTSNVASSHTIYFSITSAITSGQSFTISFPSAFTFGSLYDFTDVAMDIGNTSDCLTASFIGKTLGSTPSGGTWGVSVSPGTDIVITSGTDSLTANRCIRVTLNTNGTNHTITNPNVTSNTVYNVLINTPSDSGELALIILGDASATNVDQVSLNAKISTSILMGIDTVTNDCNNNTQTIPANQAVNFGVLFPGTPIISGATIPYVCIEAGTNSANGFRILVQSSRPSTAGGLVSGGGTIVSATANLNVAASGYGLRVSSTGTPTLGTFSATSPFNSGTTGDIGLVSGTSGTASQIITSTGPVRSGSTSRIAIELAAKSDTSTASGSYTDTLTFTAFTNL